MRKIIGLSTVLLAWICMPVPGAGQDASPFERGISAYNRGDYAGAVLLWKPLAEQGHAHAQYNLGVAYDHGHGVTQDRKEAAKWYRLAAEQKLARAQHNLGVSYYQGHGVTQDREEAVKWFRLASEQNHAPAQYNLGVSYDHGHGVTQDRGEAVKWFRLAAEQKHAPAQTSLGLAYYHGHGMTQDRKEAIKWFRLAAEQKHAQAQHNLGVCYEHGHGVTQDREEAVKWFRLAAEQNHAPAQYNLVFAYSRWRGVAQNYEEANKWLLRAAEQGHADAQFHAGVNAEFRLIGDSPAEAVKWYRLAAEQGHTAAQFRLGLQYELGTRDMEQDEDEAVKWFRKAAEAGYSRGQLGLGSGDEYLEMITIPAGRVRMDTPPERQVPFSAQKPSRPGADEPVWREVAVESFALGRYEVTRAQWLSVMDDVPGQLVSRAKPVVQVSWDDVQIFIRKLNAKTRKRYRLPTEAEWEHAARAGGAAAYVFDADARSTLNPREDIVYLNLVGETTANAFGLHDMDGNVWEWVADCYKDGWPPVGDDAAARKDACVRAARGGPAYNDPIYLASANRLRYDPDYRADRLGFRLARTLP